MSMVSGLKVVVDVQHLYREQKPRDRGAVFTLANGTRTDEASAALIYAAALTAFLRDHGAQVLTNDPAHHILTNFYSRRNLTAAPWGAHAYLACHLNAGGGSYAAMEYMSTTPGAALASALGGRLVATFPLLIPNAKSVALSSTDRGAVCIERVASGIAAVICEPFFGDNPRHQLLLAAPALVLVGEALGQGVMDWWRAKQVVIGG